MSERFCSKFGPDNFAYFLLTIAAMLYPLCFIYVSQKNVSSVESNLMRGVTISATHYLIARYLGLDVDFKGARNNKYLIIRSLIMLINQIAYTAMHYVVSVPVINILNISGSIFAFIVDYLMYGTPIHREQILGMLVGFVGVAVTVNGELILSMIDESYTNHSKFEHYLVESMGMKILFSSLYILASMLWAFGLVIQK
jgi:drug/metabolite transporter (DMT)-like permease